MMKLVPHSQCGKLQARQSTATSCHYLAWIMLMCIHSSIYPLGDGYYRSFWKTGLGFQVCEVGWPIVGQSKCEEWSFGETAWVKPDYVKVLSLKMWRSQKVKIKCEDRPLKTHSLLGYGIICHLLLDSRSRNIRHLKSMVKDVRSNLMARMVYASL